MKTRRDVAYILFMVVLVCTGGLALIGSMFSVPMAILAIWFALLYFHERRTEEEMQDPPTGDQAGTSDS